MQMDLSLALSMSYFMAFAKTVNEVFSMKKVPCEVYSRVVGYFRPVQNWNEGKKQEFKERIAYKLCDEC